MGGNSTSAMQSPMVINAASRHTATVIFLHGLGDTGAGWASLLAAFKSPNIKYICPTAPTQHVTINAGLRMSSWFDLYHVDGNGPEDTEGIIKAAKSIHEMIAEEEKKGIPSNRIMLGGFSQGGALALYSTLTYAKPLAGIIGLSCWLPLHQSFPQAVVGNKDAPVLQCHGEADPLVPYAFGAKTSQLLKSMMPNVEFESYKHMGHSSCDEEMEEVKNFIAKVLPVE